MKYIAINLILFSAVMTAYADHTVDCPEPRPPGGNVTCPKSLAAICMIENGFVSAECADAPAISSSYQEKLRFLEMYFQYKLDRFAGDPQEQIDQILRRGEITTANGARATFSLPTEQANYGVRSKWEPDDLRTRILTPNEKLLLAPNRRIILDPDRRLFRIYRQ